MKLIKINGNLTELTNLWNSHEAITPEELDEVNKGAIELQDWVCGGKIRFLASGRVRSKAKAIVEINGEQQEFSLYYNKKGFYFQLAGNSVYLGDIA